MFIFLGICKHTLKYAINGKSRYLRIYLDVMLILSFMRKDPLSWTETIWVMLV